MNDLTELTVSQVRVFPSDVLPFAYLGLEKNARTVKDALAFDAVQQDAGPVLFRSGSFNYQGRAVLILTLSVEPRRTVLRVLGSSEEACAVHGAIEAAFRSFDPHGADAKYEPLIHTQETSCVATLNLDFDALLSASLTQFLKTSATEKLVTNFTQPTQVAFKRLSFEVKYKPSDPSILEHDITVSPRQFTIEPRAGTALHERRYFFSTPTDSVTHLALLEELENQISHSGKQADLKT